ncbi:glycine, glutamate and proline-rich protein-like [Littorina saxatilis]|uniref:glycine, glutamate and proline-rich protein-like n=1 Tax=Littorina saxatilis TaxID=31220 RepID=UPI0038B41E84
MILLLCVVACAISGAYGANSCYGNIMLLHTFGISGRGVAGSHADVAYGINELNSMKSCYDQVANANCIEASIIGGIASRETNGGASLGADGLGTSDHNGYGIMQCDIHTSGLPCRNCPPKSCCHIEMMVHQKIIPDINYFKSKFPSWSIEHQVQAAIAAYNAGRSGIHSFSNVDAITTGKDYSNDVIARAQYLKSHYGWS